MMNILKNVDVGEALGLEIGASNIETGTMRTRQGLGNNYISMNEANINTANDGMTVPDVDLDITCKGAGAVKLMGAPLSIQNNTFIGSGQINFGAVSTTIICDYKVGDMVFFSVSESKSVDYNNNGVFSMVFDEAGSTDGNLIFMNRDNNTGKVGASAGINIPFKYIIFKSH